jgi:hypothetical protein
MNLEATSEAIDCVEAALHATVIMEYTADVHNKPMESM